MVSRTHDREWFDSNRPDRMQERADLAHGIKKQPDIHRDLPFFTVHIPVRHDLLKALGKQDCEKDHGSNATHIPMYHYDILMEELGQRAYEEHPNAVKARRAQHEKPSIVGSLKKIFTMVRNFFR